MLSFKPGFIASLLCAALASTHTAIASSLPLPPAPAPAPAPARRIANNNNNNNKPAAARSIRSCNSYPSSSPPSPPPPTPRTAQEVVDLLGMVPSDEKGYYVETFRDAALLPDGNGNRSVSTAIYYLLEGADAFSRWHRVDAAEVWHWYAGAPLSLYLSLDDGSPTREHVLGSDLFGASAQRPQVVVARDEWQRARSWGNWSLVGTTVAPAFVPSGFELAPPGWEPNGS